MSQSLKQKAEELLSLAGVKLNGTMPHDIQIHDSEVYRRVFSQGSLGLGESYVDGLWDCKKLDEFFFHILKANLDNKIKKSSLIIHILKAKFNNRQRKSKAFEIGEKHYDLGNDLYKAMLDKRMTYTCGYWKNAKDLEEAQEAKLDLVCKKLNLKKGDKVLDIGCGWGSFLKFASEKYGIKGVGITVSKEQVSLAQKLCKRLPIEIRLQDYKDLLKSHEKFDYIVSLGMFEHVGYKNYKTFFSVVNNVLKENGLFLLHTIGSNKPVTNTEPWISKYIFPNSMLPSISQISKYSEDLFVMEDWHNFGADYDKTLMTWFKNFNKNWPELKLKTNKNRERKYDERFYRMWKYYLLSCAGLFRARKSQLWQIVFSRNGVKGGYESVR